VLLLLLAITGTTPMSKIKPKSNLYLQRSLHTAAVFVQKFGQHPRYDTAHAPRLLHKRYLKALQQKLPKELEITSAAKLRWGDCWKTMCHDGSACVRLDLEQAPPEQHMHMCWLRS
jgi:hypothetical protein